MDGAWQKSVPSGPGQFWTATRDGEMAGIQTVAYDIYGHLIWAGCRVRDPKIDGWKGWWWSEPIEEPPSPPKWDNDI